jgi:hypothetical protein
VRWLLPVAFYFVNKRKQNVDLPNYR